MSVSLVYVMKMSAVVTASGGFVSPSDSTVTVDQLTDSGTLNGATSVPVTKSSAFTKTLSSGTGTIDLTSLPGLTAEETVNFTGLKVQSVIFVNPSTNANKITVTKGASSGYGFATSGDAWTEVLSPGQRVQRFLNEAAPDVGGSSKTIDCSGTGSQVLEVHLVAG